MQHLILYVLYIWHAVFETASDNIIVSPWVTYSKLNILLCMAGVKPSVKSVYSQSGEANKQTDRQKKLQSED